MRAVLDRVEAADYPAWRRQVERAGHCGAPVRVRSSAAAVDRATGQVRAEYSSADQPDGTLLVACGDRRARDVDAVAGTIPACTGSTLNDLRLRQPYRSVMGVCRGAADRGGTLREPQASPPPQRLRQWGAARPASEPACRRAHAAHGNGTRRRPLETLRVACVSGAAERTPHTAAGPTTAQGWFTVVR
ncbi:replication initiator [Streptomonospora salina]|uniref:replication initiator n=1 Tax=Streptomonospora salina TaxID=104205 RepID=UPI0028A8D73B|nr:replication initiator [Streptomonospora salina]